MTRPLRLVPALCLACLAGPLWAEGLTVEEVSHDDETVETGADGRTVRIYRTLHQIEVGRDPALTDADGELAARAAAGHCAGQGMRLTPTGIEPAAVFDTIRAVWILNALCRPPPG